MTTSTKPVGRLSGGSIAMEIDGFRGQLITAEHADYDTARAVWNGAVDRHPRLIARCTGTADVAAAVRWLVSPAAAFVTGQVIRVNGGVVR